MTDTRRHLRRGHRRRHVRARARRAGDRRRARRRGHDADAIHYVGTARASRRGCCRRPAYRFTLLDVVGLQRSRCRCATWRSFPKLVRATWRALRAARAICAPAVVVNVGGYASFPATSRPPVRRIPVVVVSYDRRPGLVSKLMARSAAASRGRVRGLDAAARRLTGAPVARRCSRIDRAARPRVTRAAARPARRPLRRRRVRRLARLAGPQRRSSPRWCERLADRRDLAVRHVVGDRVPRAGAAARSRRRAGHHVPRDRLRGSHGAASTRPPI